MTKFLFLTSAAVFFLSLFASAQVNSDSLAVVAKITEYQLKLGKPQNTVTQKTYNKQNDSILAQQSANKNSTAANKLSADPQNKKDARQAENAASDAKTDARAARRASDKLATVQKNIQHLQNDISKEQVKLDRYIQAAYTHRLTIPLQQADSTLRP
jgi:lipopolysaccharide export LptBFGC system permease protein LptF